jgi:hypothetical protein
VGMYVWVCHINAPEPLASHRLLGL